LIDLSKREHPPRSKNLLIYLLVTILHLHGSEKSLQIFYWCYLVENRCTLSTYFSELLRRPCDLDPHPLLAYTGVIVLLCQSSQHRSSKMTIFTKNG